MCHRLELALSCDSLFQFPHYTITNLHHARTLGADQMMLMPVIPLVHQSKTGHPVSKLKAFYGSDSFQ